MQTLFQQLLGSSFASLPAAVQNLHSIRGRGVYSGRATITRGQHPIANLFAMIAGLPATITAIVSAAVHVDVHHADVGTGIKPTIAQSRQRPRPSLQSAHSARPLQPAAEPQPTKASMGLTLN